jgi:VanZ family protein
MYVEEWGLEEYVAWLLMIAAAFVIIAFKVMPGATVASATPVTTTPGTSLDALIHKSAHLVMFAGFAWLLCLAAYVTWGERLSWMLVLGLSAFISVLSEWLQTLTPDRFGTRQDVVIDMASAFAGMGIWLLPWVAIWLWNWLHSLRAQSAEA